MKIITIAVTGLSICVGAYLFDKLCLWLENKGLLYYRHQKTQGGFVGALLDVHALLNPGVHQIIEMKQKEAKLTQNEAGVPGDLKLPKT